MGTAWWGPWLVLLASLGWATGTFATTRLPVPPNPFALAACRCWSVGWSSWRSGTLLGERLDVAAVSASAWIAWAYLGVVVTLGAFSAYAFALASLPVSTVATYAYVNPVIAVVLGAFVVGERFTVLQLTGAAVVLSRWCWWCYVGAAVPKTAAPENVGGGVAASAAMTVPPPVETIGAPAARRAVLAAQGFAAPRPSGVVTRRHLGALLERLRLLQLDSVNVAVRAHYMPVFSRLGPYDRALVDDAAWSHTARRPRLLVEYWAHEASLLPVADWPLLLSGPSGAAGGSTTRRSSSRSPPSSTTCWPR